MVIETWLWGGDTCYELWYLDLVGWRWQRSTGESRRYLIKSCVLPINQRPGLTCGLVSLRRSQAPVLCLIDGEAERKAFLGLRWACSNGPMPLGNQFIGPLTRLHREDGRPRVLSANLRSVETSSKEARVLRESLTP